MIAALYVLPDGPYFGLPDVDPWDESRDARLYAGPWPVVAHPPCERWGKYWYGGPSCSARKILGDDAGCFAAALSAVRRWGGILEHPAGSLAWRHFDLMPPSPSGGWSVAGDGLGWTCCIEQGHYGHRARKATWLYAVGCDLPSLRWGSSSHPTRLSADEERRIARRLPKGASGEDRLRRRRWLLDQEARGGKVWCCPELMGKRERKLTPLLFRDLLLSIARSALVREPGR